MKIHQLRNATLIIESGEQVILVDPMLGSKGSIPPFSVVRFKARRNPLVELPANAGSLLARVSHCLITHSQTFGIKALQHSDHLDKAGEQLIKENQIPVTTAEKDRQYLQALGFSQVTGVDPWQPSPFLGGEITAVPAQHGHGWIHRVMANGAGFFIRLPGEPSLYISGDTVLTGDTERALRELKPDIAVVAAGQAQVDIGQPLLMARQEIIRFARLAPSRVVANHMDALNHCGISRAELRELLRENNLQEKVLVPDDGESLVLN